VAVYIANLKQDLRNSVTYFSLKLQQWISSVFQLEVLILKGSAFSDGSLPLSQSVMLIVHFTDSCGKYGVHSQLGL
jgi:hypothetical protein